KQVGGDIISNKKTFLYLMAEENGTPAESEVLAYHFSMNPADPADKIKTVRNIFTSSQAAEASRKEIEKFSKKAYSLLNDINISEDKKMRLQKFGEQLMERDV